MPDQNKPAGQNAEQSTSQERTSGQNQSVAQPRDKNGLIGQTGEDHNLTGSTTYETLPDQQPSGD
jgi:hypothetical protein